MGDSYLKRQTKTCFCCELKKELNEFPDKRFDLCLECHKDPDQKTGRPIFHEKAKKV